MSSSTILRITLGVLLSTAATAAGAAREYWVYVGTYTGRGSEGVYVSRLSDNGELSAPELAATVANPAFLAPDPSARFLYAANEVGSFQGEAAGFVSAYAIDRATGRLAPLNQVSALTPGPCHVSVDASGRTVLIANYSGGSIASFPVRDDGSLGAPASFLRQAGSSVNRERQNEPHAHWIGVDPTNRFALLCDLGLDQVLVFRLDARATTLAPHDPPFVRAAAGAGPRHLAFRPDGKFAYVINELDCTIAVCAFDAARGALEIVQTVSTLPAGESMQSRYSTAEIAVHPSGRFVYGSNRGHDSIAVFAIDETSGELTLVEHVPSGGATPRNFNLDPTGRYLLSANQTSGNVVVFRVDPSTGRLARTENTIAIERPVCVVFVPVGG